MKQIIGVFAIIMVAFVANAQDFKKVQENFRKIEIHNVQSNKKV